MSTVLSRSARWTLTLCAAAALLEGFDNQSMGVAAPGLVPELALSASQAGLLFSAATFGLFLGAAIGGRMADRIGRKGVLVVSMLLFGLCSLATTIATGFTSLFVARLLTGLGLGGAMPNFITLSTESVRPERRLSAGTLVMAALPCGGALAGLLSVTDFWGGGWRAIFYFGGVVPILLALLMMRALHESPGFRRESAAAADLPHDPVVTVLFGPGHAQTTLLLWGSFFFTQLPNQPKSRPLSTTKGTSRMICDGAKSERAAHAAALPTKLASRSQTPS
jgi:MFS transporter, AAHS family, 3-hydroxyphenylpropionic acid transporter